MRVEGLEPPRLAAPEPKSGASTNFATPAHTAPWAGMKRSITKLFSKCERENSPVQKFVGDHSGTTPVEVHVERCETGWFKNSIAWALTEKNLRFLGAKY